MVPPASRKTAWPISSTAAAVAGGFTALQDNSDVVDAARCAAIAVPRVEYPGSFLWVTDA
jgi:hypothetical protein